MFPESETQQTINYYNQNAEVFVAGTLNADMQSLYEPFEAFLRPGYRILDAGCGSGRDSKHFLECGYQVIAFDAAVEMVRHASALTGLQVVQMRFDEVDFTEAVDAVWACASLLHVPLAEIDDAIHRLSQALMDKGIFYLSFKYGVGEEFVHGREFSFFTEETFRELLVRHAELQVVKIWKTSDVRPGRDEEYWLNILLQKVRTT
jgi:SAM-dependent methyltransferase